MPTVFRLPLDNNRQPENPIPAICAGLSHFLTERNCHEKTAQPRADCRRHRRATRQPSRACQKSCPRPKSRADEKSRCRRNGRHRRAQGVWIDVRSPEEFNEGHLQGAVNVPHEQIASQIARISPDKNAPVNLYCRSGRRAEVALQELKKLGYTNVTNHGGYQDLLNKGVK